MRNNTVRRVVGDWYTVSRLIDWIIISGLILCVGVCDHSPLVSSGSLRSCLARRGVFLCGCTFSSGGRVRLDGFNILAASDQLWASICIHEGRTEQNWTRSPSRWRASVTGMVAVICDVCDVLHVMWCDECVCVCVCVCVCRYVDGGPC